MQLTMTTANSVPVLTRMPLMDLMELYDAVKFEYNEMTEKETENE